MGSAEFSIMNLRLPKVNAGTAIRPKDSNLSDVPSLVGFFENVYFEPWDEAALHNLFVETFTDMISWPDGLLESFEKSLQSMRSVINRKAIFKRQPTPASPSGWPYHLEAESRDPRIVYPTYESMEHIHLAFVTSLFEVFNTTLPRKEDSQYIDIVPSDQTIRVQNRLDSMTKTKLRGATGVQRTVNKSVVIATKRQNSKPLCTIEYKGPRLNLGDDALLLKDCAALDPTEMKTKSAVFDRLQDAVGLARLFAPENMQNNGNARYELTSKDLCLYLNYMFCNLEHFYKDLEDRKHTILNEATPIAQTLWQGLSTSTGICVLNTHQNMIGFEIVGCDLANRLRIRTTPLVRCDEEKGVVALMLGLTRLGVEKSETRPEFEQVMERIVEPIMHATQVRMKKVSEMFAEGKEDSGDDDPNDDSRRPAKKKRSSMTE